MSLPVRSFQTAPAGRRLQPSADGQFQLSIDEATGHGHLQRYGVPAVGRARRVRM